MQAWTDEYTCMMELGKNAIERSVCCDKKGVLIDLSTAEDP